MEVNQTKNLISSSHFGRQSGVDLQVCLLRRPLAPHWSLDIYCKCLIVNGSIFNRLGGIFAKMAENRGNPCDILVASPDPSRPLCRKLCRKLCRSGNRLEIAWAFRNCLPWR